MKKKAQIAATGNDEKFVKILGNFAKRNIIKSSGTTDAETILTDIRAMIGGI